MPYPNHLLFLNRHIGMAEGNGVRTDDRAFVRRYLQTIMFYPHSQSSSKVFTQIGGITIDIAILNIFTCVLLYLKDITSCYPYWLGKRLTGLAIYNFFYPELPRFYEPRSAALHWYGDIRGDYVQSDRNTIKDAKSCKPLVVQSELCYAKLSIVFVLNWIVFHSDAHCKEIQSARMN